MTTTADLAKPLTDAQRSGDEHGRSATLCGLDRAGAYAVQPRRRRCARRADRHAQDRRPSRWRRCRRADLRVAHRPRAVVQSAGRDGRRPRGRGRRRARARRRRRRPTSLPRSTTTSSASRSAARASPTAPSSGLDGGLADDDVGATATASVRAVAASDAIDGLTVAPRVRRQRNLCAPLPSTASATSSAR